MLILPSCGCAVYCRIEVRQAVAECVKAILASQSGVLFWEMYKDQRDPMLVYLSPFRVTKKKAGSSPLSDPQNTHLIIVIIIVRL